MEASLIGWLAATSCAWSAPERVTFAMEKTTKNGSASAIIDFATSTWRFLRRYHAPTLSRSADPTVQDATRTCSSRGMNDGVKTVCQKSVMTARTGSGVWAIV